MSRREIEIPAQSRCNSGAVRKASRRLSHMYDTALAPTGLKITQYSILSELARQGSALPTVRELAEILVMDRSTLGQNLRPLVRDRFITLLSAPTDRRIRLIAMTKKGLAKLDEASNYWKIAQDRFEAVFGNQKAEDLRAVLLGIAHDDRLGDLHNHRYDEP
jgi:DNA-binding MarR family transcriptional regulator